MFEGYEEFLDLRKWFLGQVEKAVKQRECHKSYEGTFELHIQYPDYFEYSDNNILDKPDAFAIVLHCYVIGPQRHYEWSGKDLKKIVNKCRTDLEQWCKEDIEDD